MKTAKPVLAVFVSVLFILTSCQKETDFTFGNNRTQSDSAYLSKYIGVDTTMPPGSDTVSKAFVSYDNLKRASMIYTFNIGYDDTTIYYLRYQGSDTVPYLWIEKDINYNGPGTYQYDSIFLFYNNGFVTKDSLVNWVYPANFISDIMVRNFIASGAQVKEYEKDYTYFFGVPSGIILDSALFNVGFTSGNLSAQTLISGNGFYNTVQATYDNKKNPFGKMIKTRYPAFEGFMFEDWNIQSNNPLQVQYQEILSSPGSEQYNYIYRSDGYPVSLAYHETFGVTNFNKVLLFYTSL